MEMFPFFFISILFARLVSSSSLQVEEGSEYSFPDIPSIYAENDGPGSYVHTGEYSFLTFTFYSDSKCFQSSEFLDNEAVCQKVGFCQSGSVNDEEFNYQFWLFTYDVGMQQWYFLVDYFHRDEDLEDEDLAICDYNRTFTISEMENSTFVGACGKVTQEKIRLGVCERATYLFPGLYFRAHLLCFETAENVTEYKQQERQAKTGLFVGIVAPIAVVVAPLIVGLFFCGVQFISTFCLDIAKSKPLRSKREDEFEDVKEIELDPIEMTPKELLTETNRLHVKTLEKVNQFGGKEEKNWLEELRKYAFVFFFVGDHSLGLRRQNLTLEEVLKTSERIQDPLCSRVFRSLTDPIFSFVWIVFLEVQKAFSLWYSLVCFLPDIVDKSNPNYLMLNLKYQWFQDQLLYILLVWLIIDVVLIIWWVNKHVLNPIKVAIILPVYYEWIVYRCLMCAVYLVFLTSGIITFSLTQKETILEYFNILFGGIMASGDDPEMIGKIPNMIFESETTSYVEDVQRTSLMKVILYFIKFGSSCVLLLINTYLVLSYDGCGSVGYYHRMVASTGGLCNKKCEKGVDRSTNRKGHFPDVRWSFGWLFQQPADVLQELLSILGLLQSVDQTELKDYDEVIEERIGKEIEVLSEQIDTGNYNWGMIKNLSAGSIKFLKTHVFRINQLKKLSSEESFYDVVCYTSPLRLLYWKTVFFYACLKWHDEDFLGIKNKCDDEDMAIQEDITPDTKGLRLGMMIEKKKRENPTKTQDIERIHRHYLREIERQVMSPEKWTPPEIMEPKDSSTDVATDDETSSSD